MEKRGMIPTLIALALCPFCAHDDECESVDIQEISNDGITCFGYSPLSMPPISKKEIDALPCREPCEGCVSRKGTQANNTPHTLMDFKQSVQDKSLFLCAHENNNKRVCGGWLKAVK